MFILYLCSISYRVI